MKILLVEDEEVLASVLLKSLTKQHYVVDMVQDGQMGWEYTQATEYGLMITDVGLPKHRWDYLLPFVSDCVLAAVPLLCY
ncbi:MULTISPECIES: response regulator [unclassified Anabaena]|uniref:response regulator n=1 Tax=unclassified Anabaena TaxID=2619674 RepID=UPI0039C6D121